MVYQKIKERLVEEEKVLTSKQLSKLTVRLGLVVICLDLMMALLSMSTLGMGVTIFILIGGVLVYAWFFDMFAESPGSAVRFLKVTKLWPLLYVLFLAEFVALKFFNFV